MSKFDENGQMIINTLEENMQEYQDAYEGTFGKVDIAPSSALGSDLAITAEMKKKSDEFTQYAYAQNSPYEAVAEGLDNLCFLRGIIRKTNEHSIVLLKFTGVEGTEIPKGTAVKNTLTDELFITNEKGSIANGEFTVFATAVNSGRVVCKAGSLTELDQTIEGITSVTNPNDGILGFLKESDTDLRKRLLNYSNSLNIDEELYLKIMNIQNVKYVNIISNPELVADSNGIDPKSTSIVVLGGEPKSIAKAIFELIPADKKTVGTIQEVISSTISKKDYIVKFSRPKQKNINLEVTINIDSFFDINSLGFIRESILKFFEERFNIADDVLIDTLYIPVQQDYLNNNSSFKGVKNCSIKINNDTQNVSIAYDEIAILNIDDLTILLQEV